MARLSVFKWTKRDLGYIYEARVRFSLRIGHPVVLIRIVEPVSLTAASDMQPFWPRYSQMLIARVQPTLAAGAAWKAVAEATREAKRANFILSM